MSIPTINIPLSKSLSQRGLLANLFSLNKVKIYGMSDANDVRVYDGIKQAFYDLHNHNEKVIFYVGESGFWARSLIGALSIFGKPFVIEGNGSLLKRDFSKTKNALASLGINVELTNGKYLPAKVSGQLQSGDYKIDASFSSQHISGLLFALPLLNGDSKIILQNPVSIPYIRMTVEILRMTGINIFFDGRQEIKVRGKQNFIPTTIDLERDWSGAAFFVVYGSIKGDIFINELVYPSLQGDADKCVDLLNFTQSEYVFDDKGCCIYKGKFVPIKMDLTDTPDLFPPFVVYSVFANGVSELYGVERLYNKESNRAKALVQELSKLGIKINIEQNKMIIKGQQKIKTNIEVDSHNDHRIAMALAMIAKIAKVDVEIRNKDCVKKSFPTFFEELQKLK